jgi:hypothetical protein
MSASLSARKEAGANDSLLNAKKFGPRLRSLCALHPELTGHAMDYTELKRLLYCFSRIRHLCESIVFYFNI